MSVIAVDCLHMPDEYNDVISAIGQFICVIYMYEVHISGHATYDCVSVNQLINCKS